MSKIITIARGISYGAKSFGSKLVFKAQFGLARNVDEQARKFFQQDESEKKEKEQLLDGGSVDHLTKEALQSYESKLKQVRDEHRGIEQKISAKYQALAKQITSQNYSKIAKDYLNNNSNQSPLQQQAQQEQQQTLQDALSDLRTAKLNQISQSKQAMNNKLQKLSTEYGRKMVQARKEYELGYIKNYMLDNMKELKEEPSEVDRLLGETFSANDSAYIPNQLVIKKLYFKAKDGKERKILLAGIEQNDQDHSAYLKTLIQKLKIQHVLTLTPPDMPYFIKTQTSFSTQWMQFLKRPTPQTKFYLNPNPKTLNDITLNRSSIPHVLNAMTKSKSFYQTTFSLMQINEATLKYQHNPLYSGMIAATVENVYFCDYPFLKERQMIALNIKLQDLRQLAKQHAYYKQLKKENFSAELLLPKNVVEKKFRHIFKLAKTVALMTDSSPILICDASMAQVMSQEWKKSPLEFMQFDPTQNSYLLDMELYKLPTEDVMFMEFIEKLVILDLILQPLIQRHFVKYESFPYSCRNTVGGKENLTKVFLLWKHFYGIYSSAIKGTVNESVKKGEFI